MPTAAIRDPARAVAPLEEEVVVAAGLSPVDEAAFDSVGAGVVAALVETAELAGLELRLGVDSAEVLDGFSAVDFSDPEVVSGLSSSAVEVALGSSLALEEVALPPVDVVRVVAASAVLLMKQVMYATVETYTSVPV